MKSPSETDGNEDPYDLLYTTLCRVPRGKVVTYGQAAELVSGIRLTARMVGTAMRFAPAKVPWHRVVGYGGALSIGRRSPELLLRQYELLMNEGVAFRPGTAHVVDMSRSQWRLEFDEE